MPERFYRVVDVISPSKTTIRSSKITSYSTIIIILYSINFTLLETLLTIVGIILYENFLKEFINSSTSIINFKAIY